MKSEKQLLHQMYFGFVLIVLAVSIGTATCFISPICNDLQLLIPLFVIAIVFLSVGYWLMYQKFNAKSTEEITSSETTGNKEK